MPIWTDALIGDTMHLSAEEFGAYCLILFATWRNNGKPLPDDDRKLARICRATSQKWTRALRPVLVEFFNLEEGTWRQKRLEKEWAFVENFSKKQSDRARSRWLKNTNSGDAEAVPRQMPSHTHTHKELPPNGGRQNASSRRVIADSMIEIWKFELGGMLSVPSKSTTDRITHANARFSDEFHHDLEEWRGFCRLLRGTPFLVGDNDRHWRCDFDWTLKPKNILKVREGKYGRNPSDSSDSNELPFGGGPSGPAPTLEELQIRMDRSHSR